MEFIFFEALLIQDIFIQRRYEVLCSIQFIPDIFLVLNMSLNYLIKSHKTRKPYVINVSNVSAEQKRCLNMHCIIVL